MIRRGFFGAVFGAVAAWLVSPASRSASAGSALPAEYSLLSNRWVSSFSLTTFLRYDHEFVADRTTVIGMCLLKNAPLGTEDEVRRLAFGIPVPQGFRRVSSVSETTPCGDRVVSVQLFDVEVKR